MAGVNTGQWRALSAAVAAYARAPQCVGYARLAVVGGAGHVEVESGSTVQFRWTFVGAVVHEDLQLWFVSSKNARLLLRRHRGHVIAADRRAGLRVDDVTGHVVVVFTLRQAGRADMGTYMLHVAPPLGLYDLPAVLVVTGIRYNIHTLGRFFIFRSDQSLNLPNFSQRPKDRSET